jgi:hypothetical protein
MTMNGNYVEENIKVHFIQIYKKNCLQYVLIHLRDM